MKPATIPLLLTVSMLAGCANAPDVQVICAPSPKTYTGVQQAQAADELDGLPRSSEISQMMIDYAAERAAIRACQASQTAHK